MQRYSVARVYLMAGVSLLVLLIQGCASLKAEREFNTASRLFKEGSNAEAYQSALNAYSASPGNERYQSLLGWTHFKQGRIDESEKLFRAVYAKNNENLAALQGLAWVEYKKGRLPEAKRRFERELGRAKTIRASVNWRYFNSRDTTYVLSCISDAKFGLGLVALAEGKYSDAEDLLASALEYRNDFVGHTPIKAAMGDVFYLQGNYSKARAYFREALRSGEDPAIALKLAWCQYHTGNIEKAEEMFNHGLQTATDTRPWVYGLALMAQAANRTPESKTRLEELIGLDPAFPDTAEVRRIMEQNRTWDETYKKFASAYMKKGDFAPAYEKLDKYLSFKPDDCEARILEAWCEINLGRVPAALEKFEALARSKACLKGEAKLGQGIALLRLGRLDEADATMKQVLLLDSKNAYAQSAQGASAYLRGDFPKAIRIYIACIDRLPAKEQFFSWSSHALNNLGWSYMRTGKYREALDTFKRLEACHDNPAYPQVFDGLGWSYLYNGRLDEAEGAFRQSLALAPENSAALAGLSELAVIASQR